MPKQAGRFRRQAKFQFTRAKFTGRSFVRVGVTNFIDIRERAVTAEMMKVFRQAAQTSGRRIARLLNKTSENWEPEHRALAIFKVSLTASKRIGEVGYSLINRDPIWHLLDAGTDINYYINISEPQAQFSTRPNQFSSLSIPTQKYVWTGMALAGVIPRNWKANIRPIAINDLQREFSKALDTIVARQLI
jgi:hypothetical protein